MIVAVTGATGFLGRYIVERLTAAGHVCRCWHREVSDRSGFESMDQHLVWVHGKLGDAASCYRLVEGCQAVVHAALNRPGRLNRDFRGTEGEIVPYAENNIVGSLQLIDEARAAGVPRFIYISTCAVHERILDDRPLDETHPMWPTSHYGAHKGAVEMFVHSYGLGMGYDICALRPCGIYGLAHPFQHSQWYGLIRDIVMGLPVTVRGGGKVVYAGDVARAVELLLSAEGIAGQSYNCCGRYVSNWEIAQRAKNLAGSESPVEGEPASAKHQIQTNKLQQLGLAFSGDEQLDATLAQIIACARQ
jgi:nucleoside-diphosphate-sugar epimerase